MSEIVPSRGRPADFWVFGYGSLMWRPGFSFIEVQAARVSGFRRDMCFLSVHYRGTAETPGLVCGLMEEAGAVCHGRAFRIAPEAVPAAVAYLDDRELITRIYRPQILTAVLGDCAAVQARTYVADTSHAQFVGHWSDAEKAAAIVAGRGSEGRSLDYLASLVAHLDELNIGDAHLRRLLALAAEI
ncbi:MAG: gamma-glutamylcyclotransferase [Rhodospirillaceae bacterium]